MIDISFEHADLIMLPFGEDVAEYYGYAAELNMLDLSKKDQALYAIRKWIKPDEMQAMKSVIGCFLRKEACRFLITMNIPIGGCWLPGISVDIDIYKKRESEYIDSHKNLMQFQLLLWSELFPGENYECANLDNYRQRIDLGFCQFPDFPDKWGLAQYRPWPWKRLVPWDPVTNMGAWDY